MRDEEVVRDVERVGGSDLNAHRVFDTGWLDLVDEAHRPATTVAFIQLALSCQAEGLHAIGQTDVHHEGVVTVMDRATVRHPRLATFGGAAPGVGHPSQRSDQPGDVLVQLGGARRVLDPTCTAILSYGSAIAVELSLRTPRRTSTELWR